MGLEIKFEIVLVDDFSAKPLESFLIPKDNLKILRNEQHQGQSRSIFNGINKSSYEYIMYFRCRWPKFKEIIKIINEYNKHYPKYDGSFLVLEKTDTIVW